MQAYKPEELTNQLEALSGSRPLEAQLIAVRSFITIGHILADINSTLIDIKSALVDLEYVLRDKGGD